MNTKSFLIKLNFLKIVLGLILFRNKHIACVVSIGMFLPVAHADPAPFELALWTCDMVACNWRTSFDTAFRVRTGLDH
jgi:hypothetical protein